MQHSKLTDANLAGARSVGEKRRIGRFDFHPKSSAVPLYDDDLCASLFTISCLIISARVPQDLGAEVLLLR